MPQKQPKDWSIIGTMALAVVVFIAMFLLVTIMPQTEVIPYSDFQKYLEAGKVTRVTVSDDAITGAVRKDAERCDFVPGQSCASRLGRRAVATQRFIQWLAFWQWP